MSGLVINTIKNCINHVDYPTSAAYEKAIDKLDKAIDAVDEELKKDDEELEKGKGKAVIMFMIRTAKEAIGPALLGMAIDIPINLARGLSLGRTIKGLAPIDGALAAGKIIMVGAISAADYRGYLKAYRGTLVQTRTKYKAYLQKLAKQGK